MIARRNPWSAHTRWGVALTAAATLLVASCGNAAQFLITVRELGVVREQVDRVARTNDVSVNLQNGHVLTITVGDVAVSGKPDAERQEVSRQIAAAAYLAFRSRSQVEAVVVARVTRQRRYGFITGSLVTESRRFRPIQLIEPSGLTEHWVKPRDTSHRLYFVGVGHVRPELVTQLAAHFRQTLGITVEELPALSFDRATVDDDRSQVVAEELVAAVQLIRLGDIADDVAYPFGHARLIPAASSGRVTRVSFQ